MHTTASKITMLRMILIPVFLIFLYLGMRYWALAVFIIASASDAVDGYIARHYNQVTNFGKFMDPLADKVLVITAMCYYIEAHQMAAWVVAIVIFREFAVSGLRLIAVEQGRVIAAAKSGKITPQQFGLANTDPGIPGTFNIADQLVDALDGSSVLG